MSYTKNVPAPPRSRKAIYLALAIGFLGVNGIAALVVRSTREREPEAPPPVASVPVAPDPAREHRLAGLDAMDRGDYPAAVHSLTDAVRAGDDSPELLRLLGIAQDLRRERSNTPAPEAQRDEIRELVTSVRARPEPAAARRTTTVGYREEPRRVEPRRDEPRDEPRRDESIRIDLSGSMASPEGSRDDAPSDEPSGSLAVVPPPMMVEVAPAAAPAATSTAATTATVAPITAMVAPTSAPIAPTRTERPSRPTPPARFGEIEVQSPNVFGDVWVNGRNYGPAPRVVREIPVGSTRVEIRVGNTVRRTRTVSVAEGQRARVQLL